MSKQPKPVQRWGVYDAEGDLVLILFSKQWAKDVTAPGRRVRRVTITPDTPKAKKKKARKR